MNTILAKKLYTNGEVYNDRLIVTDQGVITQISPATSFELPTLIVDSISPAFFDLQVNGGSTLNLSEVAGFSAVEDIDRSCQGTGTGYTLPTVISSPLENILRAIDAVRNYQKFNPTAGVVGMHLEGPFIAGVRSGAHAHSFIRMPSDEVLREIIRNGRDIIKLMTIAPELFTDHQISMLKDAGITLSVGHSNASYAAARHAFQQGIHLVTHLYNAMSPFMARMPGVVGAAFDTPSVATPVILDGIHSDYCACRIAYKLKGPKFFLVSDALFVGRQVSRYHWGEFNAELKGDQYVNEDGHLAGSTISLGEAVRNAVTNLQVSIAEAVDMVTRRPALAIGQDRIGRIAPGYPAAFTTFDGTLQSFKYLRL